MSATKLNEDINTILDRLADDGSEWRAAWVAKEICDDHAEGLTDHDDSTFWLHCGYSDCRREVTRCINRRAGDTPKDGDPAQIVLPGYEHLHRYYVIERDGEDVGVSVNEMTFEEFEAKRSLFRAMGRAMFAHADELGRFWERERAA